jgi:hypothetical protein
MVILLEFDNDIRAMCGVSSVHFQVEYEPEEINQSTHNNCSGGSISFASIIMTSLLALSEKSAGRRKRV